jgi:hypothetical protein
MFGFKIVRILKIQIFQIQKLYKFENRSIFKNKFQKDLEKFIKNQIDQTQKTRGNN